MAGWDEQGSELLDLLSVVQVVTPEQAGRFLGVTPQGAAYHLKRWQERYGMLNRVEVGARNVAWGLSDVGAVNMSRVMRRPVRFFNSKRLASHALGVTEFLVRLLEECLREDIVAGIVRFETERPLMHDLVCDALLTVRLSGRAPRGNRPVDVFWVGRHKQEQGVGEVDLNLAVEIDRGTESLECLVEKGELYQRYCWREHSWDAGSDPTVVVVTTSPARARNIGRRWKEIRGRLDWAVSCWEWLERGVLRGDWMDAEYEDGPLVEVERVLKRG